MFCVIILVFITSKGHEMKPAIQAAAIPPSDALAMLFIPCAVSVVLKY